MKVKIRKWSSMAKHYPVDKSGDILLPDINFSKNMKHLCGKKVKIKHWADWDIWYTKDNWGITPEMTTKKYRSKKWK